jgi:diguanylate cyclase (GGDEF)-like protein
MGSHERRFITRRLSIASNALAYALLAAGIRAFSRGRSRTVFSLPMELFAGSLFAAGCASLSNARSRGNLQKFADGASAAQTLLLLLTVIVTVARKREIFAFPAANVDALTGVASREAFHTELNRALRDPTEATTVGLLYLDLNGFKEVNDQHGHSAGDCVLVEVARRLQNAEPTSMVARLGGDEFACLLKCNEDVDAASRATQLLGALEKPIDLGGPSVFVGASIGWARATKGDTAMTLLQRADTAMYQSKQSATNQSNSPARSHAKAHNGSPRDAGYRSTIAGPAA